MPQYFIVPVEYILPQFEHVVHIPVQAVGRKQHTLEQITQTLYWMSVHSELLVKPNGMYSTLLIKLS